MGIKKANPGTVAGESDDRREIGNRFQVLGERIMHFVHRKSMDPIGSASRVTETLTTAYFLLRQSRDYLPNA